MSYGYRIIYLHIIQIQSTLKKLFILGAVKCTISQSQYYESKQKGIKRVSKRSLKQS